MPPVTIMEIMGVREDCTENRRRSSPGREILMDDDCHRDGGWPGCEMHDLGDGDYGKCDYTGRQQECPHSMILKRCG